MNRILIKLSAVVGLAICQVAVQAAVPPPQAPASAAPSAVTSKTFAVFKVSYNSTNDKAVGGVCGTAFFVTTNKALTANHVVNKNTFKPQDDFELAKVWLVKEGEMPIEIKLEDVQNDAEVDRAVITTKQSINEKFVYGTLPDGTVGSKIETEGFVAGSQGPIVRRFGSDIKILAVPHLVHVSLTGSVTDNRLVELKSGDVVLKGAPCIRMNYKPIVGISGGPVTFNGKVIGVNSFGDPADGSTWAVKIPTNLVTTKITVAQ